MDSTFLTLASGNNEAAIEIGKLLLKNAITNKIMKAVSKDGFELGVQSASEELFSIREQLPDNEKKIFDDIMSDI